MENTTGIGLKKPSECSNIIKAVISIKSSMNYRPVTPNVTKILANNSVESFKCVGVLLNTNDFELLIFIGSKKTNPNPAIKAKCAGF